MACETTSRVAPESGPLADPPEDVVRDLAVEGVERFVEEDVFGPADEGRGEKRPLALAGGQLPDGVVRFVREPEDLEGFRARGLRLAAEPADEPEDVLQGGIRRDVGELGEIGEGAPRFDFPLPEIDAVDQDAAPVRPLDAGRELQQRALAAAVRADEKAQARSEREGGVPEDGPGRLVSERDTFEDHHDALQERGSPAFE